MKFSHLLASAGLAALIALPVQAAVTKSTVQTTTSAQSTAYTSAPLSATNWVAQLHPYVGADYQQTVADYDKEDLGGGAKLDYDKIAEDSLPGFNVHAGIRPDKYFGAELGYFRTATESKNTSAGTSIGSGVVAGVPFNTSVRVQGTTLDGMGYLPVDDGKKFELIGTAGVAYSWAKAKLTATGIGGGSVDDSEWGGRIGAGAQFNVTNNVNIRALARYQTADFKGTTDGLWIYTVGANYSF